MERRFLHMVVGTRRRRPSLDATYEELVTRLPEVLRPAAEELLPRLGLAAGPGARWESCVRLAPARELPWLVAHGLGVRGAVVERFVAAHHAAVFHGLLVDRLADGQGVLDAEMRALRGCLLNAWRRRLAGALGDERRAQRAVARELRVLHRGLALERDALGRSGLLLEDYARMGWWKLRWGGLAASALLGEAVPAWRRRLFSRALRLLLLALQCFDDAVDCAEDERLRGRSVPAALGFPRGGLAQAAVHLSRRAATHAREGRFPALARWLEERALETDVLAPEDDVLRCRMAGVVIADGVERALRRLSPRELSNARLAA